MGLRQLGALAGSDNRDAATAWAKTWAADERAKWSALAAEVADLQNHPFPTAPAILKGNEDYRRMRIAYGDLPGVVTKAFERNRALGETLIAAIETGAGGDKKTVRDIALNAMELSVALIDNENTVLASSMAAVAKNHPEGDMEKSGIEANLAARAVFQYFVVRARGQGADQAPAVAGEVRGHATAIRAAVDAMRLHAAMSRQQIAMKMGAAPVMQAKLTRALDTYGESAAVELKFAEVFDQVAAAIADPAKSPSDFMVQMGPLDSLVDRRQEIVMRRKQIVTGG